MNTRTPLAARLAALPEFDPPEALWQRIDGALDARQRQRRRRWPAFAGAALAAGLAAAFVLLRPALLPPAAVAPDAVSDLRSESRDLEQRLASAGMVHSAATLSTELELQRVESALQFAYEHGADSAELTPLWRRRVDLLAVLLQLQQPDQQVSQI